MSYNIGERMTVLISEANNHINSTVPVQNDHHFTYDIFKCIFLKEKKYVF